MPVELLDYQGNAGLGLGSSDLPVAVPNDAGLDALRGALRDMVIMNHQDNVMKYQQQIKDRDNLNNAILNNQVSTGEIEPEDRPKFDNAREAADKAFKAWGGNWQDTTGFENYQKAIQNLKDVSAHAQTRHVSFSNLRQQRAQTQLPERQGEMDSWYKKQKERPFEAPVDPFQQSFDFNIKHINDLPQPVTTTSTDKNDHYNTQILGYDSYPATLGKAQNDWLNNADAANSINTFQDQFHRYDPQQRAQVLGAINDRLQQRNVEVGNATIGRPLQAGDKEYIPPVKSDLVQGQLVVTDPSQEFAAKYAISQQPKFVSRDKKFDYKMAELGVKNRALDEKIKNDAAKLGLDRLKTNAYVRHMNALTTKAQDNGIKTETDAREMLGRIVDKINNEGISVGAPRVYKNGVLVPGQTRKETGTLGAVFLDDLPQNYQLIGGPILGDKGKILPGKLEGYKATDGSGRRYYIPSYRDADGKVLNLKSEIDRDYKAAKEGVKDEKTGQLRKFEGSKEDFTKLYQERWNKRLKSGDIKLFLKGKNGEANYTDMLQSLRLINAQATTPKEENIFNPLPQDQAQFGSQETDEEPQ